MDFLILPSYQASFGAPKVTTLSWILSLVLVQGVYFISYSIVSKDYLRLIDNPFTCQQTTCMTPAVTLLLDWFIATMSVLVAFFTNELLDNLYFSYHYLHYTKLFLFIRVSLLTLFLPTHGIPAQLLAIITIVHIFIIFSLIRIFYLLFKLVESSKSDLVAIQFSFTPFSVQIVRIFKGISGTDLVVCPTTKCHISRSEICTICYDPLSIPVVKKTLSRTNLSVNRTKVFGNLRLFRTACNHTFHRECIMKWISGKPIRMRLGESVETFRPNQQRGANCPLCARGIELKIDRGNKLLVTMLFSWKISF